MDLLLTDIQALTAEVQNGLPVDQSGVEGFSQLFQDKLAELTVSGSQATEFKDFIENTEVDGLERLDQFVSSWPEFQVGEQHQVDSTPEAAIIPAIELLQSSALQSAVLNLQNQSIPIQVATGEFVPLSGKPLPLELPVEFAALRSEPMPSENPTPQEAVVIKNRLPVELPAAGLASLYDGISKNPLAIEMPVSDKVIVDELRVDKKPLAMEIVSIKNPTDETVASIKSAVTLPAEVLPIPRQLAVANSVRTAEPEQAMPGKPAPVMLPVEDPAQNSSLQQREVVAAIDNKFITDQRDPAKPLNQTVSPPTDAGMGASKIRIPELPGQLLSTGQPLVANQSALNTVAIPQIVPTTASVVVAPVTAIPLPAQLETMALAPRADTAEWSNGLGERVSWMINNKQNIATIRLDPPALGKLDIQVRFSDDATTITIQTQQPQTRELIESASFRLREFLQESGYQNVNVDVSQRQDQQQPRTPRDNLSTNTDEIDSETESDSNSADTLYRLKGDGLVDTFA